MVQPTNKLDLTLTDVMELACLQRKDFSGPGVDSKGRVNPKSYVGAAIVTARSTMPCDDAIVFLAFCCNDGAKIPF